MINGVLRVKKGNEEWSERRKERTWGEGTKMRGKMKRGKRVK